MEKLINMTEDQKQQAFLLSTEENIAIFTGGAAILAKFSKGTKMAKMVNNLSKGVKDLSPNVPSSVRKQLDKFSANKKSGPVEIKSKKDSSFVPIKDTDYKASKKPSIQRKRVL